MAAVGRPRATGCVSLGRRVLGWQPLSNSVAPVQDQRGVCARAGWRALGRRRAQRREPVAELGRVAGLHADLGRDLREDGGLELQQIVVVVVSELVEAVRVPAI